MTEPTIEQTFTLAVRHHHAGRLPEAQKLYRQILSRQPQHSGALHYLGVIANQAGRRNEAVELILRAVALNPINPDAYGNLGNAFKDIGKLDEAIAAYRQAIALDPSAPESHSNLGNALREKRQYKEAVAALRQAIALSPNFPEAHNNLGNVLRDTGQLDESIAAYRQAIALNPNFAEAHNNLGSALKDKIQLDDAAAAFRRAIALNPSFAEAHSGLGGALKQLGKFDDAIAACRQAIALKPTYPDAHWNLALTLLCTGQFAQGWQEFEWRLRISSLKLERNFPQPFWTGENLPGQTLLIHSEGGFGDTLNFIRLVPLIAGRVGNIVVECQPELLRLLQGFPGVDQWIPRGQPLPHFDCRIPLPSLLRVLAFDPRNVPNPVPYLKAPRAIAESWQARVPRDGIKNIGLCWAGSHTDLSRRTRQISVFAPLSPIPGVRFFSLQKGPEADQPPPAGMQLIDHTRELADFADTAALIENLDLVISVDTAIVHLAGALAKPVWVLIPFRSDFRWLLDRQDSPWYPTLRLFRQNADEDWNAVVGRIAGALRDGTKSPP
ncbi:MAG: tetratricopeptide repeat-containing glycosyltransferase family protein [Tepidisphaeraceae bacterium]|jgi:tetratricopeptide (TPR) repeat protein